MLILHQLIPPIKQRNTTRLRVVTPNLFCLPYPFRKASTGSFFDAARASLVVVFSAKKTS